MKSRVECSTETPRNRHHLKRDRFQSIRSACRTQSSAGKELGDSLQVENSAGEKYYEENTEVMYYLRFHLQSVDLWCWNGIAANVRTCRELPSPPRQRIESRTLRQRLLFQKYSADSFWIKCTLFDLVWISVVGVFHFLKTHKQIKYLSTKFF